MPAETMSFDAMASLMEPENRRDPYPFLAWLREHDPVHRTARGTYLLSRHADVLRVFQDSGTVFPSPARSSLEAQFPGVLAHRSIAVFASSIAVSNPPEHTRLRKAISQEFTARRVLALRPRLTELCEKLLDAIEEPLRDGAEVDIQRSLAQPLSVGALSTLLGIPEADRSWLADMVEPVLTAYPGAPAKLIERADELTAEMESYFADLIAHRRRVPADDLITALSGSSVDLAEQEIVPMVWALWCAGFKTSAAGISKGVLAMLDNPDQLGWLDAPAFASEVQRHSPPTIITPFVRIATRDVQFDGGVIPAGADVRLLIGAANRDPAVFAAPDRFDPARDTKASMTFAGGIHFCVGAGLAKAEMEIALPRLHNRFPGLAHGSEPTWSPAVFHHMVRTLPVVHRQP
ncbi:MAG TPA: cytochrome P450 [Pseudonocardiaceae bacterium]|jgi:cytochrome P450